MPAILVIPSHPSSLFGWREATTGNMSVCRLEKHNTWSNLESIITRLIMWTLIHVTSMEFFGLNYWGLPCKTSQPASRDGCTCWLLSHRVWYWSKSKFILENPQRHVIITVQMFSQWGFIWTVASKCFVNRFKSQNHESYVFHNAV